MRQQRHLLFRTQFTVTFRKQGLAVRTYQDLCEVSHYVALKLDMKAWEKYSAAVFRVEITSVGVYMSRTARRERCVPDRTV